MLVRSFLGSLAIRSPKSIRQTWQLSKGAADDLRVAELLLGKRLTSTAGGPIAYVTAA
ncbi:hypothetical protein [Nonomuraea bangladeshensis]|uniref:hypothetical protein n=1 Tax=Nonomuraea bangladeshensis TaxID=404385 RepID=UPI003C2AD965